MTGNQVCTAIRVVLLKLIQCHLSLVIVVGGGSAGVNIARPLSAQLDASKYNLILINPRPFRVLLPATIRMIVSDVDDLGTTALVPYDKLFHGGKGTFLQDSVHGIHQSAGENKGVVVLGSGQQVPYDILILATGMSWEDPISFPDSPEDAKNYLATSHEKFASAQSYLLVGGGAVGAELAGELKDIWPGKEVTIVHGQRLLFNDTYPDKFRLSAARGLADRGVRIYLNDVLENVPAHAGPAAVTTREGLDLKADLIVPTGATHPNTAFVNSLDADALTPAGFVKVKPTLQLLSYPNIFAAGDIIDWKEQKQAIKAGAHSQLVTKNVISYIKGAPLKNYSTAFEALVLTNGKRGGLSYFGVLWGIVLGSWFTRLIKSKSLLVPMFRKESGQV
ncbi:FAD/NAD(P)-binding domain-containing protein [Mycena rosella]|uniref:FAD/NAD(P)-binding domain-containing protein n=1 Tax=Mycena rosella TaxID=1033263 RepID=A0AAD7F9T4_MYCRO|nr:FAD/NAD(P)-binding domain-containing protein [Mycena rosella]